MFMRNNSINWIYTTKNLQKFPNFFLRKKLKLKLAFILLFCKEFFKKMLYNVNIIVHDEVHQAIWSIESLEQEQVSNIFACVSFLFCKRW
jgi:hypothetical protein